MIRVTVRNYRSVERADVDLDGIVLLAGDVESGKSSMCSAIGATLAQKVGSWRDAKIREAAGLVRDHAERAKIEAADAEAGWKTSIYYPSANIRKTGMPPPVHPVAAGLKRYVDLLPDARLDLLNECLPGDVTIEDLQAYGESVDLEASIVDLVWDIIGKHGWDGALERAEQKSPEFRLKYQETTGTRWDVEKSATWVPDGWSPDLLKRTPEELATSVKEAEAAYRTALREDALSGIEFEAIQKRAAELPTFRTAAGEARAAVEAAEAGLEEAEAARDALPAAVGGLSRHDCPHCGEQVEVRLTSPHTVRGKIRPQKVAVAKPSPEHDPEVQDRVAKAEMARGAAERALADARRKLADAEARVQSAEDAAASAAAPKEAGGAGPAVADVLAARDAAVRDADMLNRVLRARNLHRALRDNYAIRKLLEPEGVRATVLGRRVEKFNGEILAPLIEKTAVPGQDRPAWPTVELQPDMTMTWGGRPWNLCSASAQWRMNAVMALGVAVASAQPVVVLDGADILPVWALNGLVSMLRSADTVSVVGLTSPGPEKLPKLAKAGLGRVYWLGGGHGFERKFAEVHG